MTEAAHLVSLPEDCLRLVVCETCRLSRKSYANLSVVNQNIRDTVIDTLRISDTTVNLRLARTVLQKWSRFRRQRRFRQYLVFGTRRLHLSTDPLPPWSGSDD